MINMNRMEEQLILHEGLRLKSYKDTVGKWTIGVGYNLTDRGPEFLQIIIGRKIGPIEEAVITKREALLVLHADLERVEKGVRTYFPEYDELNEVRQRVCCDMAFNIGYSALNFKQCLACIKKRDWSGASRELWKSKWSTQVGDGPGGKVDRADRLTKMLLTGVDYVV